MRLVTDEEAEEESETEGEYETEEGRMQLRKEEAAQLRKEKIELENKIKEFYETHPNGAVRG